MILTLAVCSCLLALIPAALFLRNLTLYASLPSADGQARGCSVLIPARNEEENIAAALQSVLQCEGIAFEVIVLDDSSTDRTAQIVRDIAASDKRVLLERADALPPGWCGKSFACHQLAALARQPYLVFMDADVRVSRTDTLARLLQFLEQSGAALVSGVPRQETESLLERLVIPLIHFVLLAFLPLRRMRTSTDPRFAAACGQIVAVRAEAYRDVGGHAAAANRLHEAMALAHTFRSRGFTTDLFDATDTFSCRMYRRAADVWNGFAKNAHEGMATRRLILPSTVLLLGGQVLPLVTLALAGNRVVFALALVGSTAAFLPRIAGVVRFRQSIVGALFHPFGVAIVVAIQWFAFLRTLNRRPMKWKNRAYLPT